jgi:hypothetical protein
MYYMGAASAACLPGCHQDQADTKDTQGEGP